MGRAAVTARPGFVTVADNVVSGRRCREPCGVPPARPLAERRASKRPDNVIVFRPRRA